MVALNPTPTFTLTPPSSWQVSAEAHYLKWLREAAGIIGQGKRVASTPKAKKKKARTSGGFFDNCDSSDEEAAQQNDIGAGSDSVVLEIDIWKAIGAETIDKFKDEDGLVDEFALAFSLREQVPVHFALFKQLAADLPHEANAESTFSLSGSLSHKNTHTSPGVLSTYVRINKNRKIYNPSWKETFKAYRTKFGTVKGEDAVEAMSDDADDEMDSEQDLESDAAADDDDAHGDDE